MDESNQQVNIYNAEGRPVTFLFSCLDPNARLSFVCLRANSVPFHQCFHCLFIEKVGYFLKASMCLYLLSNDFICDENSKAMFMGAGIGT